MEKLNAILQDAVPAGEDATGKVAGAAFIVTNKDEFLYSGAAGRNGLDAASPAFSADSFTWIASMSKVVTAVCLMQLVERDLVKLDDDLRPKFPEMQAVKVLRGFKDDGEPILEENTEPITLRMLMSHTSGYPYEFSNPRALQWSQREDRNGKFPSRSREAITTPLVYAPAEYWNYGTGVQKPSARPPDHASALLRKHGSSADLYRPGAAAAATRERMYQMLEAAASAEGLSMSPTSPTRNTINDTYNTHTTRARPIAVPRSRPRPDLDVEMLEASMPPPPVPTRSNGTTTSSTANHSTTTSTATSSTSATTSTIIPTTTIISSSLPLEALNDSSTPSGNSTTTSGNSYGLKRSASNSSQTVTIYECPTLEVDDQCGNDEDLSWLSNDQELEQMLAMSSSQRRPGARSSLAFRRSSEAAMQCSQVVRNVPRMRKRRDRKLDRRRLSSALSESTICLSSSPSPTATPAG
ncbi:hypothetical protein NLG97_g630 [Lecanicillium saksenae]|uniref:Uncharacterized protein n=1 Tax=Lecanicillium saksenae TaxID=468837 RepID=A0ACC1R8P9_9HYPO|nr:hypothetical protein NLG97_g630 [Lecanicillium saksenae]